MLGVKVPTGVTDRHTDTGELVDAEFQPGTGSWDGLFGLAATKRIGPWSFDANVLYILATEGTQDTDLGDRFQYNAAVSYRILGGPQAGGPCAWARCPNPCTTAARAPNVMRTRRSPFRVARSRTRTQRRVACQGRRSWGYGCELWRQCRLLVAWASILDRQMVGLRVRGYPGRQRAKRPPSRAGLEAVHRHLDSFLIARAGTSRRLVPHARWKPV